MIPDRLLLTPEGRSALLSAEAGGIKIRPASFRIGNYSGVATPDTPTDILGDVLFEDTLFLCEVISGNTARFTVEIPKTDSTISITEATVKLESGETLGYVRTSVPYDKAANRKIRLSFMLHLDENIAHVIDVTLSTFGSVPSVISLDELPSPVNSIANTLVVLDLQKNGLDDYSPELVYRFGAGGSVWGFSGCTRLFNGNVNFTDSANFEQDSVIEDYELETDDEVICFISSGKGAGSTRRFKVIANKFMAVNAGFVDADNSSVLHIWRQIGGISGSAGLGLPDRNGVGPDWVLVAGESNKLPYWAPASNGASKTRGNIYNPPGKLKVLPITLMPTASQKSFVLYNEDPLSSSDEESWIHRYSYRKNPSYSMIALGNVNQLHTSYNLYNNMLEFPEDVPIEAIIDARLFELDSHTGTRMFMKSNTHVGDSLKREFDLPALPEDSSNVFVYLERTLLSPATYTIDLSKNKLVFYEAPKIGLKFEINVMAYEDIVGFATLMHVHQVTVTDSRRVFVLPFSVGTKENILINLNGLHLFKDEYVLIGNKIVTNVDIQVNATGPLDLEFIIFENVRSEGTADTALRNIVVDAVLNKDGLVLIRNGADNIPIPLPKINITSSDGIKIEGNFPNFHLTLPAVKSKNDQFSAISKTEKALNSNELNATFKVEFRNDIMIKIDAYFEAQLGPGFKSSSGLEEMQFGVGFKTLKSSQPELGRNIKGTGISGFSVSTEAATGVVAYSNGSVGDAIILKAENNPQGYIEIVATLKLVNTKVGDYGSNARITLSGIVIPVG
jgi:hypothetical protein